MAAVAQTSAPPAKAATTKPAASKPAATKPAPKPAASKTPLSKHGVPKGVDELDPRLSVSDAVTDFAGWVIATGDNRELPFAVIDKKAAQILIFGADGKLKGLAPTLLGSAVGDQSAPGVGDRELNDIPAEDRTTPAGRYLAGFGPAAGGETVLWIDYINAVSIHAIPATKVSTKEKRKQRLASLTVDDNRITHGCINVSPTFYSRVVKPTFKKGGIFYVLPDTVSLHDAFPAFEQLDSIASAGDSGDGATFSFR